MLFTIKLISSMAEWSKALVYSTRHFDSVGSNPTPVILVTSYTKYCFLYFENLRMVFFIIIHAIDLKTYRQGCRVV